MAIINIDTDNYADFLRAVAQANAQDRIVYHRGATCYFSPLRLWALGASDAGMVILAKTRISSGESNFEHIAVRTKKKFKAFKKAPPIVTY